MPGRPSDAEIELLRAAESGDREAMHALGEWYLDQFDEGHYRELLDPATLCGPISERDRLVLESQARSTQEERDHYVETRRSVGAALLNSRVDTPHATTTGTAAS